VEQRQTAEDHVIRAQLEQFAAGDLSVRSQVAVRQFGTLRATGRSGRVQQHRGVLDGTVHDRPRWLCCGEQVSERCRANRDYPGIGLGRSGFDLLKGPVPREDYRST
jgi:hypothetical protein